MAEQTTSVFNPCLRATLHRALSYADGLTLQRAELKAMAENPALPMRLLLAEHTPVITLGRSGTGEHLRMSQEQLQERGVEFYKAGRGGDVTYHGPGQWTAYPLLRLEPLCKDLHRYMRLLEDVVILYLDSRGVRAGRKDGRTGVWVGRSKICAIGVAVSRWISWHGLALNINTDLRPFREYITPCGITPEEGGVTSLQEVLGRPCDMPQEAAALTAAFCEIFHLREYR